MEENECYICKKKSKFNGFVYLSDGKYCDLYLRRSHYLKWCKSKGSKEIELKYKKAKPTTKEWNKRCQLLQKEFDKWMEEQLKSSLGIKDSSSTKNEIHSQQEEFSTCEKVKNSVLTPADTIHSKNKELMDNDYKDLEEKIENCPNCECKFKTGEHDVEMCKYLNR